MNKEDKKLLRLDVTQATLAAMTILLVLMTACLVSLRGRVVELEREIQAVEQRAMEREMRLMSLPVTETAAETPVLCLRDVGERIAADLAVLAMTERHTPEAFDEDYVLRVLTAEAGTDEVLCGCVAQALYNACERHDWAYSPAEMMVKYRYTDPASWVSAEAEKAWDEVFCSGVTWDCVGKATVFYTPAYCESAYHESQRFVVEIGGVRFFEEVQR